MKTRTYRDGITKKQPNNVGTTPQWFAPLPTPTSCAIFLTMPCGTCYMGAQNVAIVICVS